MAANKNAFVFIAITGLLITGCADMRQGVSHPVPSKDPSTTLIEGNYKSVSLVKKAKQALKAENFDLAESLLERAIRKDPYNGWLWFDLATVNYERGDLDHMLQLCKKSLSLAQNDTALQNSNRQLMQQTNIKK